MDASEQIYRVLSASDGVAAITSTVRPLRLGEHDTMPAIVYTVVGTDPAATLGGDTGNRDRVRVQIDAWADEYGRAQALAFAVRNALRPRVAIDDNTTLIARFIDSRTDYNTETRRHRVSADYYVWQSQ